MAVSMAVSKAVAKTVSEATAKAVTILWQSDDSSATIRFAIRDNNRAAPYTASGVGRFHRLFYDLVRSEVMG